MKHYYFQSRLLQRFKLLCIVLTSMTLMHSCSGDFPAVPERVKENVGALKEDSVLRFPTIDELENISVSDIPGEYSGYTLTGLSYECVDTIELRALRYNVTATLQSTAQQKTNISFTADVGPELVSVEYYPNGIHIAAHDNMAHNFYGFVERYRNYSDGSRIGPDEFYDYGHPLTVFLGPSQKYSNSNKLGVMDYIASEYSYDEMYDYDEAMYFSKDAHLYINLNTKVITEQGKVYSGEDLYPLKVASWKDNLYTHYEWMFDEDIPKYLDDYYVRPYYNTPWLVSRPINIDNPETYELVNLGRNVPDVSPVPYPKDEKSQQPGWYFNGYTDNNYFSIYLLSNLSYNLEGNIIQGYDLSHGVRILRSYLVIDGRIIHYDNNLTDYEGIRNIEPEINITKVEDGYKIIGEVSAHLYGAKYVMIYNLHVHGVNGPINEIDLSSYNELGDKDSNELNNLSTRSIIEEREIPKSTPREDGKSIEIDRRLPNSISNLNTRNSIIKK